MKTRKATNMGLGLQGAYALDSLDKLLRQRYEDDLKQKAIAEQIRQFDVGATERSRAHDLTAESVRSGQRLNESIHANTLAEQTRAHDIGRAHV